MYIQIDYPSLKDLTPNPRFDGFSFLDFLDGLLTQSNLAVCVSHLAKAWVRGFP